jgi:hypothetical protein
MNTENGLPQEVRSEEDSELDRVESRRRLLKAGLVAVPFLVTLHALPARAGGARGQGSLGVYGYGDERDKGGGHGKGGGKSSGRTGQQEDR